MLKHIKTLSIIITSLFISLLLTGCWDAKDINEKLIVTTIAFSIEDEEIWFYLEVANIESGGSDSGAGGSTKYKVMKGHGKTLTETRENLNTKLNQQLYLSGVWALIFTEEFAQEYLVEYLYRFRVDETYRKKGQTVITKEDPDELFKKVHDEKNSVGLLVDGIIDTLDETGNSFKGSTIRLLENLSCPYTGTLLPCIGYQDESMSIIGYSVIKDSTVIGFLPADESIGTMILKADKPKFFFIVPYNDMNITIEVLFKRRKITPIYKNEKVTFAINIKCKADIIYGDKKTPYYIEDAKIKEINQTLTVMLEQEVFNAIKLAQDEFDCDYFEFDDIFRIKFPNDFESMNWEKEFPKLSLNINIDSDLSTKWSMDYGNNETK